MVELLLLGLAVDFKKVCDQAGLDAGASDAWFYTRLVRGRQHNFSQSGFYLQLLPAVEGMSRL